MAKSLPPLTWFRTFEAAARSLSFTAAAEEIGMTQSAVSQQVKALETRLGVALFTRHARGLSITDEGRKLLPQVGAALETLAAATRHFETGGSENLLTVATSVSVAQWIIAPHLPSFRARHPEIRLRFLSAIWPDDFTTSRADVEVRFGSERQVGHKAVALTPNGLFALKSPKLAGPLTHHPLIEAVGTSAGWAAWQQRYGGDKQPALYVDSFGAALHLAAQGNGVALVSEILCGHALKSGLIEPAHPGSVEGKEGYFLATNDGHPQSHLFRDWLLEIVSNKGE